jgi:hypothetical protein
MWTSICAERARSVRVWEEERLVLPAALRYRYRRRGGSEATASQYRR